MLQKQIKSVKYCLEVAGLLFKLILIKLLLPYKRRKERLKKEAYYNKYKQEPLTEEEIRKRREEKERIARQRLWASRNNEKNKKLELLNKAAASAWLDQLVSSVESKRISFDNPILRDGVIIIMQCDGRDVYSATYPYDVFFAKTNEIRQEIRTAIDKALKNADLFLKMMEECEKRDADEEPLTVDMGLSVNWAFRNVGAHSASDYGDQFAWGETVPKTSFSKQNYPIKLKLKYTVPVLSGKPVNLQSEDDVATMKYGKGWRMPSENEFLELEQNCYKTHLYRNDGPNKTNGVAYVSRKNGHILYFPAEGAVVYEPSGFGMRSVEYKSLYWSSTIIAEKPDNAKALSEYEFPYQGKFRFLGGVIRPVREK